MEARYALRLYQDAWLFDYDSVRSFIERLDHLHSILKSSGGQLSDKTRIWHCLNCLEDADPEWVTNLIDSTLALPPKLAYWTVFRTWAAFSKELICRAVDATALLPGRETAGRKKRPSRRTFRIEKDALSDASSISDDGINTDTASYAGSDLEDGYETDYATRARKASGSHNPTAEKGDRKPKAGALTSKDPRRPKPRRKFGARLHEFTDYQFHCDDDSYFADEDQKTVVINGERRFLIPGNNQARRSRRGLLIDAERGVLKFYFFKRFAFCPKCSECKLRHPVETYSFCRYCYFCHLGGEEECYHLHPELRGTRSEKGKYRRTLDAGPDIEHVQQTGPTFSIDDLSEFGYDSKNAMTRGAVQRSRRRILFMPVEEQGDAVQALLQMITDDRCDRKRAQDAKLAKEQQRNQQQQEREERERQEREQLEKERLEKERLAVEWQEKTRLAKEEWDRQLLELERLEIRQRGPARQETQHRVEERLDETVMQPMASNKGAPSKKKPRPPKPSSNNSNPPPPQSGRNKRQPKPKPSARGASPALPSQAQLDPSGVPPNSMILSRGNPPASPEITLAAPSTSRGPSTVPGPSTTQTLLGSSLIYPEQPPATAVPDTSTQTPGAGGVKIPQRLEAPAFMKNRRRWSSMESLSTSSSEESIQQFDKARREAKNKMLPGKGPRGGADERPSGPRRNARGRAAGGAALT
ncbi:hypothetical protein F503_08315 [Ophiostoma piceae UAMH 11346]|uniref:Uncharacterized protein n=1 Tax=Ophiostoma piceae (strain UAMH 11346) TaxID=1262450 RepID=S3BX19_OPHP1|nr:hypothetical protein F503_08315 [Ophiostoma piceae UAMH 11346]